MAKKKLSDFLEQTAPYSCTNRGAFQGNSDHRDWPSMTAKCLRKWDDFSAHTFEYLYSGLLKTQVDCPSLKAPPKQMTVLTGEDSVERLIVSVFQPALGHVLESIRSKLGREIWVGPSSFCNLGSNVSQSNKPDWTSTLFENGGFNRSVCYCPGDTKSGNKFDPNLLFQRVEPKDEYDVMLPIRQAAHYARLSKTRYAYIVTEREFVAMRISFEEATSRLPLRRIAPTRTAAPEPGMLRYSGMSTVSDSFSAMSLDSFSPEDATGVEMAVFPWADRSKGLTGFGAWFWLLIIASEPEANGMGHAHSPSYLPLHAMIVTTKSYAKVDKRNKKVQAVKDDYTSLLNGVTYHHKPGFAVIVSKPRQLEGGFVNDEEDDDEEDDRGEEEEEDENW